MADFPPELLELAGRSPGVVLLVLGLYLFKVVVNDLRHDAAEARRHVEALVEQSKRQSDVLERIERLLMRVPPRDGGGGDR